MVLRNCKRGIVTNNSIKLGSYQHQHDHNKHHKLLYVTCTPSRDVYCYRPEGWSAMDAMQAELTRGEGLYWSQLTDLFDELGVDMSAVNGEGFPQQVETGISLNKKHRWQLQQKLVDMISSGYFDDWPIRVSVVSRDLVYRDVSHVTTSAMQKTRITKWQDELGPLFVTSHADVTLVADSRYSRQPQKPTSKRGYGFRGDLLRKGDTETETKRRQHYDIDRKWKPPRTRKRASQRVYKKSCDSRLCGDCSTHVYYDGLTEDQYWDMHKWDGNIYSPHCNHREMELKFEFCHIKPVSSNHLETTKWRPITQPVHEGRTSEDKRKRSERKKSRHTCRKKFMD